MKNNFAIRYGYKNSEILSLADKLETEVKSLMTLLSSKNRNRRGLVDLKGDLLQFMFGTASERDVARISKALDQLKLAGKKKQLTLVSEQVAFSKQLFLEYQYQNELMNNLTKKLALVRQECIINKNKQDHILDHLHIVELEVAYLKLRQALLESQTKSTFSRN